MEFNSLLPMLGGHPSPYKSIYGCYLQRQRSIRHGRHKLIVYPTANVIRLDDVANDLNETNDLADSPEYRSVVRDLFANLLDLQSEMKDTLDLTAMKPVR